MILGNETRLQRYLGIAQDNEGGLIFVHDTCRRMLTAQSHTNNASPAFIDYQRMGSAADWDPLPAGASTHAAVLTRMPASLDIER